MEKHTFNAVHNTLVSCFAKSSFTYLATQLKFFWESNHETWRLQFSLREQLIIVLCNKYYCHLKPGQFKDLFSSRSKEYASSRPKYPKSLFEFLVGLVLHRNQAWDCATGNGQAAVCLSEYFEQVIASGASKEQIANAKHRNNICYKVFPAEKTMLEVSCVDLITIAQALHWFDLDDFYKEARKVLEKDDNGSGHGVSGSIIAAWAYGIHSVSEEIDTIVHFLYEEIVGPYWLKERKIVENKY